MEKKHCIPWLTASALSTSKPNTLTAPSAGSLSTQGAEADCAQFYTDEYMGLHLVHELLKVIWPKSYQKPSFFLFVFLNFFRLHVFPMNIS